MQAGIVVLNGNARIAGCQFEHIASIASNSALYQATAITFIDNLGAHELVVDGLGKDGDFAVYNCKRGIYAGTSQGHTRATITNCRMEQIQNGILLDENLPGNFVEAVIEDNYIESSIYVGATFERATAIEVRDPSSWHSTISIQRNEIEVDQPGAFGVGANLHIVPTAILVTAMLPQVGASASAMTLTISDNDIEMTAAFGGIRALNVANALILDNHIHNVITGDQEPQYGIEIVGGISNTVQCNAVTTDDACIGIFNDSSVSFSLDGNSVENMFSGVTVANDNGTDCVFRSNAFSKVGTVSYPTLGLVYNGALTGPQYLRGNLWDGSFTVGAVYSTGPTKFTYCDSKYQVSPDANIVGSSSNNVVIIGQPENCGDWFTVLSGEDEDRHDCVEIPATPGLRLNNADLHLASSGGTSSLSPGFKWSAEMGLYRKFSERPDLIQSQTDIINFLQKQDTLPLAAMYAVRNDFVSLFDDSGYDSSLTTIRQQMQTIRNVMDTLLPAASGIAWTNWSTLSDQLDSLYGLAAAEMELYVAQIKANAYSVRTSNNAITCDRVPCANEQYLHDLFLSTQIMSPRILDSSELAQVKTIASTCPGEGGPAIYQARAWYYLLTNEMVQDSCSNSLPDNLLEERAEKYQSHVVNSLRLQPNPADETTQVVIPSSECDAVLYISDSWGCVVRQIPVTAGKNLDILVPTASLMNGVYTVTLLPGTLSASVPVAKLIVAH